MMGKLVENKREKLGRLCDAAYELFTSNGVHNTVVDDIVKNAGVAKGTFYLYFRDKYDLVDRVITRKISALVAGAMKALEEKDSERNLSCQEGVIFFADYLLDFFRKDPKFLDLIFKNLSLDLYEKLMKGEETAQVREAFIRHLLPGGGDAEAASKRLYIIVSMVGFVCYNSIIFKGPYSLDEIKEELYRSVVRILT